MEADHEGFLYPVIDDLNCINCYKCKQACPILCDERVKSDYQAYAVINKNDVDRQTSSSGGFFSIIAKYVIENGGYVIGSCFDHNFNVMHICTDNLEELKKINGSKYLQSNLEQVFSEAKGYLRMGKLVLFTGTPCQVAGLKTFLKKDYDNLITQDIICHGVPSPRVWSKYLDFHRKKMQDEVKNINFRHKEQSWYNYKLKIEFQNNTSYECNYQEDIYMRIYLMDFSIRPSCYQCKFKNLPRVSDYTLGDFWGVDKVFPDMFDDKGTSLLIINTVKAQKLFDSLKNLSISKKVESKDALKYNPFAIKCAIRPRKRKKFFEELDKEDFFITASSFLKRSLFQKVKGRISNLVKNQLT